MHQTLYLILKGDSARNKRHENEKKANALAKSKELQPNSQNERFAAHLLLPQLHNLAFDNPYQYRELDVRNKKRKSLDPLSRPYDGSNGDFSVYVYFLYGIKGKATEGTRPKI